MNKIVSGLAASLVLAGTVLASPIAMAETKRSIEQIKGDVYLFRNKFHNAMFVVTEDGIVVTDPINSDAVEWLKAELKSRFNKPVTHMILSHHHGDHASGGKAWGDIAVVAHEKAKEHIAAGKTDTALPTITFSKDHTFTAGGKTFEMTFLGQGHSDDLIATIVRPENVAFVVDAVSPNRVPYRDFPNTDIDKLIKQIKSIEALDFEVLAPGHSVVGVKGDAAATRVYVETLRDGVKSALAAGKSVEEIVASDIVSDYKEWGAYENWRALNIQGMARWLKESGQAG